MVSAVARTADMSKAVHRRAARRKERVRRLDVDRVAGESLKNLKEVRLEAPCVLQGRLSHGSCRPLRPCFTSAQ